MVVAWLGSQDCRWDQARPSTWGLEMRCKVAQSSPRYKGMIDRGRPQASQLAHPVPVGTAGT